MSAFIHLIADYGVGDPAFSEVVHRLHDAVPDATIHPTAVTPLSTVATGFWIEQLGCYSPGFDGLWIYSNTAPRTDLDTSGGPLRYLRLDGGANVVAVDVGYNLSFIRDRVETYRNVPIPETRSQFRSRDHFPEVVGALIRGDDTAIGEPRSTAEIPERPDSTVCHVDGYGNVKTSVRTSELDIEDPRRVTIAGVTHTVHPVDSIGELPAERLGLVPGSAGGADPYLELFVRGGSAAEYFDHPVPGDDVRIEQS